MKRLAVLACALGVLVACNSDIGTGLGIFNGDTVSADLDLITIDSEPLPFLVNETGDFRTEVLEGTLTLRSDGTWERFSRTRVLRSGSSQDSDVNEGGTYTLEGETLTLSLEDPNEPPLSGTFSNGEATVQISVRIDFRDPDPEDTGDLGCDGVGGFCLIDVQGSWLFR
jgi:hypothetical protein